MYYRPETQDKYTNHSEIRSAFPQVSLPSALTAEVIADLGVVGLVETQPAYDPITHTVREGAPVLTQLGQYQQAWEVMALDAETVAANQARAQEQQREAAKSARTAAVAAIKVTTVSGKVFDGDEASQERMVRAIKTAELASITTGFWTLADNSRVEITIDELKEALVLAAIAQNNQWSLA